MRVRVRERERGNPINKSASTFQQCNIHLGFLKVFTLLTICRTGFCDIESVFNVSKEPLIVATFLQQKMSTPDLTDKRI